MSMSFINLLQYYGNLSNAFDKKIVNFSWFVDCDQKTCVESTNVNG